MVKPLNKEWALFGRKYRVPGAKGEKVDCNECHKQVSAAVNRLQSHLRVCPARPTLPPSLSAQLHRLPRSSSASDLEDATGELVSESGDVMADAAALGEAALASVGIPPTPTAVDTSVPPAAKRPRTTSPTRPTSFLSSALTGSLRDRMRLANSDEFWSASTPTSESLVVAKRRLEVEEKRLQLELQRDQREQQREQYQLQILESQARRERLLAEKEAYDSRVVLALSRKQLRDQGVDQDEIDRILPIPPSDSPSAAATSASEHAGTANALV